MHNFGAKKGEFGVHTVQVRAHIRKMTNKAGKKYEQQVRAHSRKVNSPLGNIPARPFMTIHPEVRKDLLAELADFILK